VKHTWENEKCMQTLNSMNLKGRDNLGNLDIDGRIILKLALEKYGVSIRNGFIWLTIWTSGRLL
jgi:hypothetical protein